MMVIESPVNDVLRNPYRVLRHLELDRRKIAVMRKLGLYDGGRSWEAGCQLLCTVKAGRLAIAEAIREIGLLSGVPPEEVRADLLSCYATGLVEFHATDVCDIDCLDCHYRDKDNATFPFGRVAELFARLVPRCATVTGGGEPSCYASDGKTLNDLILHLHAEFPEVRLGIINYNTSIPAGEWPRHVSWQRSSLDASHAGMYRRIKGRDKYDLCVANVMTLLDSPIPHVGVGFLYRGENVDGMYDFLADWYERWQGMAADAARKFNIQFRPLAPAVEAAADHIPCQSLERQVWSQIERIHARADLDAGFDEFLRACTNFASIRNPAGSFFLHTPTPFRKCHNALLHRVVRADGSEYPDFLLCNHPDLALGNTLAASDPEEERIRIALGTFYYHHRLGPYCDPASCRQCWVSRVVETYADVDVCQLSLPDSDFF